MGETNVTSSKRKSSSSSSLIKKKKKSSHDLDKVDKKKKSSRSKIRKSKTKRLRRRDNSSSYSDSDGDDGDERSKSLSSSDSFFDDHKRKRSRSRTRNDGKKKSKKRSRKCSPSRERERYEHRRVKKRKELKRNIDSDTKKKSRRKKHKRDVKVSSSSSSSSSSSLSCSISCGASNCEDSGRNGSKRRRYRSPSCSSMRRTSEDYDYQTEENLVSENTSRRLKSVITVVKELGEKEVELDKEEIIHDQDDYRTCRSNDGDEAKMKIDEEMQGGQEFAVMGIDVDDRYEASYLSAEEHEGPKQSSIENKNEDFTDEETNLRQRALENLIRFREELKMKAAASDPKKQIDDAVKQSPPVMTALLPRNEDGAKVPSTVNASQENIGPTTLKVDDHSSHHRRRSKAPELVKGKEDGSKLPSINQGVDQIGIVRKLRNSISSMQDDRKLLEGKYTSEDTVKNSKPNTSVLGQEHHDARSSLKDVPTSQQRSKSNVNSNAAEITKPSLDIRDDSGKQVNNNAKQVPTSQQGPKSNVDSNAAEISKPSLNIRGDNGKQVNNNASMSSVSDPCVKPKTGEQCLKDVQRETKEASQYEQKTMSVMRGGEMVQVSYKVYIPKKTPALARRQLQR